MPDWKTEIKKHLVGLNLSATREDEIIEELSQHLDDRYRDLRAARASDSAAYHAALTDLDDGHLMARELRRIEHRAPIESTPLGARRKHLMDDLLQDLRYGLRTLLKTP